MKIRIFFFLALTISVLGFSDANAQKNISVQGTVVDTLGQPLAVTTAVLLNAADSVIKDFTITDKSGTFQFKAEPGEYIVQLSFMGFKSISRRLTLDGSKPLIEMGLIGLTADNFQLPEIRVSADKIPIAVKKDTVEYNAAAFKTQENAKVEDLLKRLPGVEVEQDGSIKAQGETVTKVLVDGKEFFTDDPKIATKNLPADAVNKVQVFDKMSEEAEFTGVDDGERTKTINLELKEDRKQGGFGAFTLGYGTDDRYEAKFSVNRFSKNMQISALGMANNINERGFSFDDYTSFMGGFSSASRGGGGFRFNNGSGMPISNGSLGNGVTTTWASGVNMNVDFNKRTELNTSYFFNRIQNDVNGTSNTQNITDEGVFSSDSRDSTYTANYNHRINFDFEHRPDSTSEIDIDGNISYNDGLSESFSRTTNGSSTRNSNLSSDIENFGDGTQLRYSADGDYRKKLNSKGRSILVGADISQNTNDNITDLYTYNALKFSGNQSIIDTVLQEQWAKNETFSYGFSGRYTEPIGKFWYVSARYRYDHSLRGNKKDFYDLMVPNDALPQFNADLSNDYQNVFDYNRGTISLQNTRDKYYLSVALGLQQSNLRGSVSGVEGDIERSFVNFLPSLRAVYRFSQSKRLYFRYATSVNEPSVQQLQPVLDNSNPLNLYQGNPNLKPEYRHTAYANFFSFSQYSFTSFFASLRGTYTENKITNLVAIDSNFARVTSPLNVDQDYNLTANGSFGRPIKPLGIKFNVKANLSYTRSILFVNLTEDKANRWTRGGGLTIENNRKNWLDIRGGFNINEILTVYDNNKDLEGSYLNTSYFGELNIEFLKDFNLSSRYDYFIYGGQTFSGSEEVQLLTASLSYFFLKDDRGELKMRVYDVLNQNQGVSRTSDLNFISEDRYSVIGQYAMLSFTYDLKGRKKSKQGGMKMMMHR